MEQRQEKGGYRWIALDHAQEPGRRSGPFLVHLGRADGGRVLEMCPPNRGILEISGDASRPAAVWLRDGVRSEVLVTWLAPALDPPELPAPAPGRDAPSTSVERSDDGGIVMKPPSLPVCEPRDVTPPMLRCARAMLNISQGDVARGTGLSTRTIVNAEQGPVSEPTLVGIVDHLVSLGVEFCSDGRAVGVSVVPRAVARTPDPDGST